MLSGEYQLANNIFLINGSMGVTGTTDSDEYVDNQTGR